MVERDRNEEVRSICDRFGIVNEYSLARISFALTVYSLLSKFVGATPCICRDDGLPFMSVRQEKQEVVVEGETSVAGAAACVM